MVLLYLFKADISVYNFQRSSLIIKLLVLLFAIKMYARDDIFTFNIFCESSNYESNWNVRKELTCILNV